VTVEAITPLMIEKALVQTIDTGSKYAAIPMPWLDNVLVCWVGNGSAPQEVKGRCLWPLLATGRNVLKVDGEGNVLICLMEPQHEGEHGPSLLRTVHLDG
jgi:hypothetical protein